MMTSQNGSKVITSINKPRTHKQTLVKTYHYCYTIAARLVINTLVITLINKHTHEQTLVKTYHYCYTIAARLAILYLNHPTNSINLTLKKFSAQAHSICIPLLSPPHTLKVTTILILLPLFLLQRY